MITRPREYGSSAEMLGSYGTIRERLRSRAPVQRVTFPRPPAPAPPVAMPPDRRSAQLEAALAAQSAAIKKFIAELEPVAQMPAAELPQQIDQLTVETVMRAVCAEFKITRVELTARRRQNYIVLRRHIALVLCMHLTRYSLPHIGRHFGLHHTSVMHAGRRLWPQLTVVKNLLGPDASLKDYVIAMRKQIHQGRNGWGGP